jgi:hypothetical protein
LLVLFADLSWKRESEALQTVWKAQRLQGLPRVANAFQAQEEPWERQHRA